MIQGQILRLTPHREAAIYLRDGALWVADFLDGRGTLAEAATWFRFNCSSLETLPGTRRMLRESAIPLNADLVQRIEELHASRKDRNPDISPRNRVGLAPSSVCDESSHRAGDRSAARSRFVGAIDSPPRRVSSGVTMTRALLIGLVISLLVVVLIW